MCTSTRVTSSDAELIHSFTATVTDERGRPWSARGYGRPHGNVWLGWIVFANDDGEMVETETETSQPDRGALEYWATGIEPIYLDGALARARGLPV
jgi:hypothetical protein